MEKSNTISSCLSKIRSVRFLALALAFCLPLSLASCSDNDDNGGGDSAGPVGTDLGEGANCYIVSEAGDYYFKPLHVSGAPIENVRTVDWVWTTLDEKGEDPHLISDLDFVDGVVKFKASGKKGSTIIAAFGPASEMVWTWHIWCTDQPEVITYENGAEFMDRYLGAIEAGYSPLSVGMLYQWGRKDPFFSSRTDGEGIGQAFLKANESTLMNPELGYKWETREEYADLEKATLNPTTYFYGHSMNWMEVDNHELWGTEKTDYDPSPAGWRIASSEDWLCLNKENFIFDKETGAYSYTHNNVTTWWPVCGVRDTQGGELVKPIDQVIIWACGVYEYQGFNGDIAYFGDRLSASPYLFNVSCPGNKAFAQGVRCVKIK